MPPRRSTEGAQGGRTTRECLLSLPPRPGPMRRQHRGVRGAPPAVCAGGSGGEPGHGAVACATGYSRLSGRSPARPGKAGRGSGRRIPCGNTRMAPEDSAPTSEKGWEGCRVRASNAPVARDQCISLRMAEAVNWLRVPALGPEPCGPVAVATKRRRPVSNSSTFGAALRAAPAGQR